MNHSLDMKKIERLAYLKYHQDGIWDILIGLGFLGVGVLIAAGLSSYVGVYPAIIAAFIPSLIKAKKSFTQSRLGYIQPSASRRTKEKRQLMLLQIAGFLSLAAGIFNFVAFTGHTDWQTMVRNLGLIPLGMVLSATVFIVGSILAMKRFMVYGILILGFFIFGHFYGIPFPEYFALLGLIISISGTITLIRFLRKYPKTLPGDI